MKIGKIILILVLLVLVAAGVGTWYLLGNMDRIVKEAVQEAGTEQLGTAVSLQSVSISLPEARATLNGLRVANPAGYSDEPVFVLGLIDVDIDLASLNDDVLIIEDITVRDPQVNFEMDKEGVSNLDVLEKKLTGAGTGGPRGESRRLIIDRLDFKGGQIRATAAIRPEEELVFDFPVVFLTDLGRPNGATADEIAAEVAALLLERSMSAAKRAGVQRLVDVQKERLKEKAEEKLEEKLKDLLKRD